MKKSIVSSLSGICILALLTGCVNHVKDVVDEKTTSEQEVLKKKYYVTLNPVEPRDTQFKVTIEKDDDIENKTYKSTIRKKCYIPYSAWRKLYEIPTGFVLLPCSVISHVGWIFCLGLWDYDFTWDVTCKSFAGMNPFINWETTARMQEELISVNKELVKTERVTKKSVLQNSTVTLKTGKLSKDYKTNEKGTFDVHLFSLNPGNIFFPLDRKISFYPADSESSVYDIVLKREFIDKLNSARELVNIYNLAPTGKRLYDTSEKLKSFGFKKLGNELEVQEQKKHATDEYFKKDFSDAGGIWIGK